MASRWVGVGLGDGEVGVLLGMCKGCGQGSDGDVACPRAHSWHQQQAGPSPWPPAPAFILPLASCFCFLSSLCVNVCAVISSSLGIDLRIRQLILLQTPAAALQPRCDFLWLLNSISDPSN